MARGQIGQEQLAVGGSEPRGGRSLDDVAALVDWTELDCLLAGISASAKGEPGWPPLALFKALLLATWHDLSDVRLAEALDDRASFRRFCGFAAHEPTPERTAFVRFRAELVQRGLDRSLFEAVTRQLDQREAVVRTGTLAVVEDPPRGLGQFPSSLRHILIVCPPTPSGRSAEPETDAPEGRTPWTAAPSIRTRGSRREVLP